MTFWDSVLETGDSIVDTIYGAGMDIGKFASDIFGSARNSLSDSFLKVDNYLSAAPEPTAYFEWYDPKGRKDLQRLANAYLSSVPIEFGRAGGVKRVVDGSNVNVALGNPLLRFTSEVSEWGGNLVDSVSTSVGSSVDQLTSTFSLEPIGQALDNIKVAPTTKIDGEMSFSPFKYLNGYGRSIGDSLTSSLKRIVVGAESSMGIHSIPDTQGGLVQQSLSPEARATINGALVALPFLAPSMLKPAIGAHLVLDAFSGYLDFRNPDRPAGANLIALLEPYLAMVALSTTATVSDILGDLQERYQ